jgi:hypothetical protein
MCSTVALKAFSRKFTSQVTYSPFSCGLCNFKFDSEFRTPSRRAQPLIKSGSEEQMEPLIDEYESAFASLAQSDLEEEKEPLKGFAQKGYTLPPVPVLQQNKKIEREA